MPGSEKPLPGLPVPAQTPTTLTVQARRHRLRFIRLVLDDESAREAFSDEARDAWAHALEDALDELGTSITRGGWLAGIRRARAVRNAALLAADTASSVEVAKEAVKSAPSSVRQSSDPEIVPGQDVTRSDDEGHSTMTLKRIKDLVAQSSPPGSKTVSKRLLLCLAPLGSMIAAPKQTVPFPDSISCAFSVGTFTLPDEDLDEQGAHHAVLFGVEQWDAGVIPHNDGPAARLVGGTFSFKGVTSPVQYRLLAKALRVAAYVHLSLILEQHFLASCHVQLQYPKPRIPSVSLSFQPVVPKPPESPTIIDKSKSQGNSFLPSATGILSFFTKRTGIHRSNSSSATSSRGGSLDLTRPLVDFLATPPRSPQISTSMPQEDNSSSPLRRFSFIHNPRPSFLKPTTKASTDSDDSDRPFVAALKRIEGCKDMLSTSVGVTFDPPPLLVQLAQKEKQSPDRRLKGDERTGLTSILGWEGKESKGKGMYGLSGFVRQQGFSVLCSAYVPSPNAAASATSQTHQLEESGSGASSKPSASELSASSKTSKTSSTTTESSNVAFAQCGSPKWLTYRYYSCESKSGADKSLGETISELAVLAHTPCQRAPVCPLPRGAHEMRLIHGGVRITLTVQAPPEAAFPHESDFIEAWQSCAECGASTSRTPLSDGAYLLSFAKFLELLVYSPKIHKIFPILCDHTSSQSLSSSETSVKERNTSQLSLPTWRFNLVRHFACQGTTVTVRLECIKDIYEIRVPRLQILRTYGDKPTKDHSAPEHGVPASEDEKKALRREIKLWWEGISDHIDKLEDILNADDSEFFRKSLPRLPSSDDAYDDDDNESTYLKTPIAPRPPTFLPNTPVTPTTANSLAGRPQEEYFLARRSPSVTSFSTQLTSSSTTSNANDPPVQLLAKLRHAFQSTEQSLYSQLGRTPVSSLNDVRRAFLSASRGANRRLLAWQKKHLSSEAIKSQLGDCIVSAEPEWWAIGCHAVPGGNVIVRENDWGSIIAYTLGTVDFQRELANMSASRSSSTKTSPVSPSVSPSTPSVAASTSATGASFFSTPGRGFKLFSGSNRNLQPDADQDDVVWHEPDSFSAVISRKQTPRDETYLLSIRDVLRKKSPVDGSPAGLPTSILSSLGAMGGARSPSGQMPPMAWAKPDVQLSMQAADGQVVVGPSGMTSPGASGTPESEAGKILQEIETAELSRPGSSLAANADGGSRRSSISSSSLDGRISALRRRSARPSSDLSSRSDSTIGPEDAGTGGIVHGDLAPDVLAKGAEVVTAGTSDDSSKDANSLAATPSSITTTIATSLHYAMRFVTGGDHAPESRPGSPMRKHHGLLSADVAGIDERPHIKYDWTVGNRLKFSCTVYYAKQFDLLRRRCGIEDVFLKSISRSANWAAQGGKSRSNFWKTSDDRFIIKTLVNAWNVADLQVLLELAPSYFRYMESTASRATVLAKLLGFYTIEIRNLETGAVQSKADLLVMENLFYDQKVVKTFDLKGIQGRKVKSGATEGERASKTLFDGEWIEGQQRTLTLVRPHSKVILREAIKSDAEFLSKSNIMDYSLLLGVDDERKEIACGLVDTIGSYTFAKTLEYKAKHGLNARKDVTVVPPNEYQERFVSALDGYFLACPDKWSQPMCDVKIPSDPTMLPSVL